MLSVLCRWVFVFAVFFIIFGCKAEHDSLPVSKSLSSEKVASIAETIKTNYPNLSTELRGKVLNMVVQSIDNMIFVEGGQFDMGDFGWACEYDERNVCAWPCGQDSDQLCSISPDSDDDFVHSVVLSGYYISKFQVVLGDFDLYFFVNKKSLFDQEYREREDLKFRYQPNLPAPTQTWQEARDYCQWLGDLSGYAVGLPTEAQWEYAARSRGKKFLFPTDSGSLDFGRNFPVEDEENNFPVDRFAPNPLGIYGFSGNSTDWVSDWYGKDYYKVSPLENPQGPEFGTQKIRRGSTVLEAPLSAAPMVRRWAVSPMQKYHTGDAGFRCAVQSVSLN
ncbi:MULTISPECIES: SUMF1/EgtB/PvdO family nonheme iron enzyme [Pseudomonas]|jgi:formylglycine-generating enzyme required for sulfatase activity|uniref:formylglycine-generating enzyme family protein n=1 Tax=Pseudomonas TaxID=286 RepID=UPI000C888C4D|nr:MULTISPECIES: SUMF1/EgtB/PvdO family nonheme iron enzyme [Pseudomonas]PMZ98306.1 hypothetical protein C1X28_28265 [Pseudomonas sp. FW305-BF15]PNB47763.1 hypothetical protein C1X29_22215 [Pseudomonas sp. GW456-12-10-14-LB2]PNB81450.1 hypothetical protein C1X30_08805 [Pseudomonas sp. FW305-BF6]